jgi:beta-glucanase (GH16 family)
MHLIKVLEFRRNLRFDRAIARLWVAIVSIGLTGCSATVPAAPTILPVEATPSPVAPTLIPPGPNWQLAFADEFDKPTLDASKWDTCFYFVDTFEGTPGCKLGDDLSSIFRPDDVLPQTDGTLLLQAQKRATVAYDKPYTYTTGMLSSLAHYTFTFGYAEIRMKASKGQGLWNAFWLMPASKKWPPEIDVLEILGRETQQVHTTLHYKGAADEHLSMGQPFSRTIDLADDFHIYAAHWTKDVLIWYVDGVERFRQTEHIPREPMYVIATLSAGNAASWAGEPDATTRLPNVMQIDYIRVYQAKPF